MIFEYFPDELILRIFCYLHKFDLFYAFTKLNRRFEQIITPYLYDIDLARGRRPFNRHFTLLCQNILPSNGDKVRSVKLAGLEQLKLFRPHIRQLTNLQSLTIHDDNRDYFHEADELDQFLIEALSTTTLLELSVFAAPPSVSEVIASSASNHLTTLTLIFQQGFRYCDDMVPMASIKYLSINLNSVEILVKLFEIMPYLEELNLYFGHFVEWQKLKRLEIPHTLKQLQLTLGEYNTSASHVHFIATKELLGLFRCHLRSLTLIIINGAQEFSNSNKLQSLVKDFTRLETFQYYINTTYQPDSLFPNFEQMEDSNYIIYTVPKLNPFETPFKLRFFRPKLNSDLTINALFNGTELWIEKDIHGRPPAPPTFTLKSDLKLVNLHSIAFFYPIEEMTRNIYQYASHIIAQAPNLTHLKIHSGKDTRDLIEHIYRVAPSKQLKKVTAFTVWLEHTGENGLFHSTVFFYLSKIMMNLQILEISIPSTAMNVCLASLDQLIRDLRKYFGKLTYLKISTWLSTDEEQKAVNSYKNHLFEISQQTGSWVFYTTQTEKKEVTKYRCLKIWL